MAITNNDIKIYQSQDNTDNDSGGGSRTSAELIDGDVNNLFPDISRIDTTSGDVALRKIFPTVATSNRDIYYGAHAMLRKTPTDPKVSALIFHTNSPNDTRLAAQNKIESYVTASYKEEFYLFGNHIEGAKVVTWLQHLSATPPSVGEVYMLRNPDLIEQYVRVASLDTQEVTFTYFIGGQPVDFKRRRIICEIEQPLKTAFVGSVFDPTGQTVNTADTFATQVSDAAKFYSTKTLALNALIGETNIKVDSIFEQVVPAAKSQTPLINKDVLNRGSSLITTGIAAGDTVGLLSDSAAPYSLVLNQPITPNTLHYDGGIADFDDDGKGNIINSVTGLVVGSVDYINKTINSVLSGFGVGNSGHNDIILYTAANTVESSAQFTSGILVTSENQGLVFVRNLSPLPQSQDLYVDYRSQGKWQRIQGYYDGTLGDDPTIGAGLLNNNGDGTGTVSLTLGALPDQDSTIIFSWASNERLTNRAATTTNAAPPVDQVINALSMWAEIDLGATNIDPLSFVMSAPFYGSSNTIGSTAEGVLTDTSGYGITGHLNTVTGKVIISKMERTDRFTSSTNSVTINFSTFDPAQPGDIKTNSASKTPTGNQVLLVEDTVTGVVTFNLGEPIADLGSFVMKFLIDHIPLYAGSPTNDVPIFVTMTGRSDGTVILQSSPSSLVGTINTSGDVSLNMIRSDHRIVNPAYTDPFGTAPLYIREALSFYTLGDNDVFYQYRSAAQTGNTTPHAEITGTYGSLLKYKINIQPPAGDIYFTFPVNISNLFHELHSEGDVIYDGYRTQRGTLNRNTGEIEIGFADSPTGGDINGFNDMYLRFNHYVTDETQVVIEAPSVNSEPIGNVTFKTAATKLTTSSFQLRYTTIDGVTHSATSDANGVVTGVAIDSLTSRVDTLTGMADVHFTDSVLPATMKYDAVAETTLPLDPDLLGLDPVRLPPDGRVPVFRSGSHLIIFNEVITPVVGGTPVSGQVDTLARSGQAYIEVIDANGKRLDPVQYIADKIAGTVTFGTPLLLQDKYGTALTAPYFIVDRIEDMALATDVQLNGVIGLSSPLIHDYNSDTTSVASALVWGDTGARAYNLFEQEIWNSGAPVWSNNLIGDSTTAQYDEVNNPIQIDNANSTSGRWAIIFTSSTTVSVVEENLGVLDVGINITTTDVAPINPATGLPYFTMLFQGFGAGWVTNNVIRFNTDSGGNDAWLIRTVQSGTLSEEVDGIEIEIRGDAN